MKEFIIILVAIISFASCSTYKNNEAAISNDGNDTIRIANDSLEYEILIFEPRFNSWLKTQRPRGYYSQTFLESRNILYVTEFNQRTQNYQRWDPNLYFQEINYKSTIDYGYEVNYLLYHYFVFFQIQYDQNLIAGRGY